MGVVEGWVMGVPNTMGMESREPLPTEKPRVPAPWLQIFLYINNLRARLSAIETLLDDPAMRPPIPYESVPGLSVGRRVP
jgi:hypothetical protein